MKTHVAQGLCLLVIWVSLTRIGAPAESDRWPKPSQPDGAPLALQVLVYNYAKVSNDDLRVAQEVTTGIYGSVGIRLEWLDCYINDGEPKYNLECRQLSPTRLVLRILPRSKAEGLKLPLSALGFAQLDDSGGFGHYANVFYHRVEELSGVWTSSRPVVLGHVMAHEMGHLLLGLKSHSRKGLMTGNWQQAELEHVNQGAFTFSSQQAKEIRARFLDRLTAEASRLSQAADER